MAVTRAAAATYLVGMYGTGTSAYLTLAGIGLTDAEGGLKEIIDDAFLEAGIAYADLATGEVPDTDAGTAFALLRYTALTKVLANLNAEEVRGKLKIGDIEISGLVDTVKTLIGAEYAVLTAAGFLGAVRTAPGYLGGSSWTDMQAREADRDRVAPAFPRTPAVASRRRWGDW